MGVKPKSSQYNLDVKTRELSHELSKERKTKRVNHVLSIEDVKPNNCYYYKRKTI